MSDAEYALRPNKTQLKREIKALNKLGQELVQLSPAQLDEIPLGDTIREAIIEARRLQRGALQRQYRRIASLMQEQDTDAIRLELSRQQQPSRQQTEQLHQLEAWRDGLIADNPDVIAELMQQFPEIDRQYLMQLARNARAEAERQKPPRSARQLFQYLSKLQARATTHQQNSNMADRG